MKNLERRLRSPRRKQGSARENATWQLQEAKNRLSEVVQFSIQRGPQTITRHGIPSAVVISFESFQKLSIRKEPLVDFLLDGLKGANLDLRRANYPVEEIGL